MKKIIFVFLNIIFLTACCNKANAASTEFVEISKEQYYDKTLACMLGHIAGFLSGFEFVDKDGGPYVGLPDEWFSLCYGPYGGGPKHGSAGKNCVRANGKILQDDDYHVDFFNQLIFDGSENLPTSLDIQRLWKKHQVRDWGGGAKALEIINKKDFIPPFIGQLEHGNIYSWCTEPYIENETVGCIAPGMPQTADMLTNRFAQTTGEYESVIWARFFGVMYSVAYFETNAVDAMKKASAVLPEWSYAKFMYDKALEVYEKHPEDWRTAAKELSQYGRYIYLIDNVHVAYDVNGGFTVLSVLYGNNDYYESIKIASLIGYDSDCTAAAVGGLLGIIKGMSGTHAKVKEVIYDNGNGILINDGTYVPYIPLNYPEEQKFTDIALLYQKNTEKVIAFMGGEITDNKYIIPAETVKQGCDVIIPNRDFENELIQVGTEFQNGAQGGIDKVQTFAPHSGGKTARIVTNRAGATGKVYLQTQNTEAGKVYKVTGYLVTKGENNASLFVQNGTQFLTSSTYNNSEDWYCRSIVFKANENSVDIGLYVPPAKTSDLFNAYLDDITIDECRYDLLASYEAETFVLKSDACTEVSSVLVNASGNKYIDAARGAKLKEILVNAKTAGEHLMRIRFSNISSDVVTARVMKDGNAQAKFPFYITGNEIAFEENIVEIPVDLSMGENTLSIEQFSGSVSLDKIEIVADSSSYTGVVLWSPPSSMNEIVSDNNFPVEVNVSFGNLLTVKQIGNAYSSASIFSILGKHMKKFQLSADYTSFPLTDVQKGAYILLCTGDNKQKSVKFIY